MQVSDSVKNAYKDNSITKYIALSFPQLNVTVDMEHIHSESMSLRESLLESDSIEFVGCIASQFKINVQGLVQDVKGKSVTASIHTQGTDPIPLFHGVVDSAKKTGNKGIKEIVAYDELYTKGQLDVSDWYEELFPTKNTTHSIKEIRDSLFEYIGIEQIQTTLVNDSVTIRKRYAPSQLQALAVIKALCQFNGVFGIINRDGVFEYRVLSLGSSEYIEYYKGLQYEEFSVNAINNVTIRDNENQKGKVANNSVTNKRLANKYIVQGNMFAYKLTSATKTNVATNILHKVRDLSYIPFNAENNGLPYIEVGDIVTYKVLNDDYVTTFDMPLYVFSRELKGIQALRDNYTANGRENQNEFVTDLNTSIDYLVKKKSETEDVIYEAFGVTEEIAAGDDFDIKNYIDEYINSLIGQGGGGTGGGTPSYPSTPDPDNPDTPIAQGTLQYQGPGENLSQARYQLAATHVGNYALFGGGNSGSRSNAVDAYNSSLTKLESVTPLSQARYQLAATHVGVYALFGGGYNTNVVDAYNSSLTKLESVTPLSQARYDLAATHVGVYALFGGGYSGSNTNVVDAYNSSLTRYVLTPLSKVRHRLAATHVGVYALFGGGYDTNVVDAYNSSLTKLESVTPLSQARYDLAATYRATDDSSYLPYALFGGGNNSNVVDAYNSSLTKLESVDSLSQARYRLAATHVGVYALFGGGYSYSNVVDAYNLSLTNHHGENYGTLYQARYQLAATHVGNYALFGGGYYANGVTNAVDVYKVH